MNNTALTDDQINALLDQQSDLVDELDQLNADYRRWHFGEQLEAISERIEQVQRRLSYVNGQLEY